MRAAPSLACALVLAACATGGADPPLAPEPLPEFQFSAPAPGMIWRAGYWHWDGVKFVWVPGHWDSPRR